MIVRVNLEATPAVVTLQDPDTFDALKVAVEGKGSEAELGEALSQVGRLGPGGDAFLDVEALQGLAGPDRRGDADWQASFAAMIGFAREHGWVDAESGALQAHVERQSQAP